MNTSFVKYYFLLSVCLLFSLTTSVFAVDGYKVLKFGMTKQEVIATGFCNFGSSSIISPGIEMVNCIDFKFSGKILVASIFFAENKFLRLGIVLPVDMLESLVAGLSKKYGAPCDRSPQEAFNAVDRFPNRDAYLAYDSNTVFLRIRSNQNGNQSVFLIYSSSLYDTFLVKKQQETLSGDL